jgi:hypothetical protein
MDTLKMQESAAVMSVRKRGEEDALKLEGRFLMEHWRNGEKIAEYPFHNLVTNEGKNRMFNTMFKGTAQLTTWYVGLVSSVSYTALAVADDYADIGQTADGWKEFTGYNDDANAQSSTTRPAWAAASASAQAITNSTPAIFDITSPGTIKGAFICGGASAQTKGDHTAGGVLWSEGLFSSGDNVAAIGDQLKFTYSVGA